MDSMDFGLGRFLEMFEDRFGRWATTVLLGLIALAIVTFTIRLIVDGFIIPVTEFIYSLAISHQSVVQSLKDISALPTITNIFMMIVVGMAMWKFFHHWKNDRMVRMLARKRMPLVERVRILFWISQNREATRKFLQQLEEHSESNTLLHEAVYAFVEAFTAPDAKLPLEATASPTESPAEKPAQSLTKSG
jgi:hypothetical protein